MEGMDLKTKINDAIRQVLEQFGDKYFVEDLVNKSKVIQDLDGYDASLLEAFITNETIKNNFTIDIAGNVVMQTNKLIELFEADEYWQDSYTKYSKIIGLTAGGKFIDEQADVVLDFPYKDTLLKASMSKEDTDKDDLRPDEPFLNEVIAKEEIDVLLDKKILINAKKYDENGVHDIDSFDEDDNLIMKWNNLLALKTLKEKYTGKVKIIYIDPPYNTGGDSFHYNNKFNHSTWLTFIQNRLEIAKDLLSNNGSIWINIDDDEQAYLKVLCDNIFGRNNFINNVIWQKKYAPQNDAQWFTDNHDHILVYAKDKESWKPNLLPRGEKQLQYYKHDDLDGRGPWRTDNILVKSFTKDRVFPVTNPNTQETFYPPEGRCWRYSRTTFEKMIEENRIYWGKDGKGRPQVKRYLKSVKQGITPLTIWLREEVGDNQEAKGEINNYDFSFSFETPKP